MYRNINSLMATMRQLFNQEKITTYEFSAFKELMQSYAKSNNLYFDNKGEQLMEDLDTDLEDNMKLLDPVPTPGFKGLDIDAVRKAIEEITPEEIEKYFPQSKTPKGWVSIEDHLPQMYAADIFSGGTEYKVRHEDGTESTSIVGDHNAWYYFAIECGITHWFNE